jgi:betaine-aldehyde dehydrogenase
VLVQKAVAEQVRAELIKRLAAVKVGPASDPESEMGPVIDKPNVARISKMVEEAIAAGAKPLLRGGAVTEMPLGKGSFYRPTLLEVFDSSLPIVQKEVFGPVPTLQVFETEADAVALSKR